MLGPVTGVGHYASQLAEALLARPEIESLGVFDGLRVVPAWRFLRQRGQQQRGGRGEAFRARWRGKIPYGRAMANWARAVLLERESRRGGWSLFHEPNYIPPRWAGPVVATVHDLAMLRCPEFLPADRLRYLRSAWREALERCDALLTDSQFTRAELLELCPWVEPARVHVTRLGVDHERFRCSIPQVELERVRQQYQLPSRYLLYLGTLEPRKNLQGLLRAYRLLPLAVRREVPLVLAGMAGWNQAYFRPVLAELARQGALRELGYVPGRDVAPLMRGAEAFCFPSWYEGFGLPPLEAAACGTPVVASRTGSLPEVLGDAAVWVDPRDPESIADGLLEVLEDESLRAVLRRRGPERAQQFTWSACAAATWSVYRQVLDDSASTHTPRRRAA